MDLSGSEKKECMSLYRHRPSMRGRSVRLWASDLKARGIKSFVYLFFSQIGPEVCIIALDASEITRSSNGQKNSPSFHFPVIEHSWKRKVRVIGVDLRDFVLSLPQQLRGCVWWGSFLLLVLPVQVRNPLNYLFHDVVLSEAILAFKRIGVVA